MGINNLIKNEFHAILSEEGKIYSSCVTYFASHIYDVHFLGA